MYVTNPYAQGGWTNANSNAANDGTWNANSAHAPTFGALPTSQVPTTFLPFHFIDLNPNILSSTVIGPGPQSYFKISSSSPGFTQVQKSDGKIISVIEWQTIPFIEIRGIIPRQTATQFLALDVNARFAGSVVCSCSV